MELIAAVLAWHGGQGLVGGVENAVADVTLFDTIHLVVNVVLPQQDG
jgi:hypothetical protein